VSDRHETDAAIIASYRTVARALDRVALPLLIERGVTMAQFKALMALNAAGDAGISITALGHELSIGQPSASLIVDQLAKRDYAVRRSDETDRRRVFARVTPTGRELADELRHGRRSTFEAWLKGVADEDADSLARGLRGLAGAVEAADASEE
jgi:DNA-binding MarR family transcriptional regulator